MDATCFLAPGEELLLKAVQVWVNRKRCRLQGPSNNGKSPTNHENIEKYLNGLV